MKKLIFIILLKMILSSESMAQDTLEYVFPKTIHEEIDKYVKQQLNFNTSFRFFFILHHANNEKTYSLFISCSQLKNNDNIERLLKHTNRIVKTQGIGIPLILGEDFKFVAHGFYKRGDQTFPVRADLVGELYYIKFNVDGTIIKTGY